MSGKLDQSLDEILSTQRRTAGRRRSVRRPAGQPVKPAPVGGIHKTARPVRSASAKTAPTKAVGSVGISKVVVSNMVRSYLSLALRPAANPSQPKDVSEAQIKVCYR